MAVAWMESTECYLVGLDQMSSHIYTHFTYHGIAPLEHPPQKCIMMPFMQDEGENQWWKQEFLLGVSRGKVVGVSRGKMHLGGGKSKNGWF